MTAEMNAERRNYYQMLWETGAAQSDAAAFSIQNIDWQARALTYTRSKTRSVAMLSIRPKFGHFLQKLSQGGPFFPTLCSSVNCKGLAPTCSFRSRTHSLRYSITTYWFLFP